jgi:[ribosomal protein S18]-alanine N-acetyltransferase
MREFTIAAATNSERDWCARLMAASEPWLTLGRDFEDCVTRCSHPEYLLYVAHEGAEACGFVLMHPRGVAGSPYVASVAVAAEFRGRGVGTRLMEFAEAHFRGGARHIFLCVSSFNGRARALYERMGYEAVGDLRDYVIEGASETLMKKRLVAR